MIFKKLSYLVLFFCISALIAPSSSALFPDDEPDITEKFSNETDNNSLSVFKNILTTATHLFKTPSEHEMLLRDNIGDIISVEHNKPNPPKKNIISTVIFLKDNADHTHNKATYINGLLAMIKDVSKIYGDDWFLRVYYDDSISNDQDFISILEETSHLDCVQFSYFILHDFKLPGLGHRGLVATIVRYLPLFEPFEVKVVKNCRSRLTYYDKFKFNQWLEQSNKNWFFYNFPLNHFFGINGGQYSEFITSRYYVRHHSASFACRAQLEPEQFLELYKYLGISLLKPGLYTAYGIDEYSLTRFMYESKQVDDTTYEVIHPFGPRLNSTQERFKELAIDPSTELFNDGWERVFSDEPAAESNFSGLYTTMYSFGMNDHHY